MWCGVGVVKLCGDGVVICADVLLGCSGVDLCVVEYCVRMVLV